MGSNPVKLNDESYSLAKGLKNAITKTLLPALGATVAALFVDPQFVQALQDHYGVLAAGSAGSFVLMLVVNWAKNRNLGK